jgi:hypothetical protein
MVDDLDLLRRNRKDWTLRATKRRPRGYTADEAVRIWAKKEGVQLGRVAKGTVKFKKAIGKNRSLLDMVRAVYKHEVDKTGRRFVIRMTNGKLEIIPYQRNSILYQFKDQIIEALLDESQALHPHTVIIASGRLGSGKGSKKLKFTAYNRSVVQRFGKVTVEKDYGRVSSLSDLKEQAHRDLAKAVRIKRTGTLSVPGVPFIRRGEGIQWENKEPGWHGASSTSRDRTYVFTTAVRHSVSGGVYETDIDVQQNDPFVADQERLDKLARQKARARRKARNK